MGVSFGADVDYAVLVKLYGPSMEPDAGSQRRYSPAECIVARKERIGGSLDPVHISTSCAERQNLTLRTSNRRFTRFSNAFSKKVENHPLSY